MTRFRWLGWVLVTPGLAGAVALLDPRWFGLSTTPIFLHLIAFRALLGAVLLGAALIAALTLLLPPRRPASRPWIRRVTTAVLAVTGLSQFGVVVSRGWAGGDDPGTAALVVIEFNTYDVHTTAAQIAGLVRGQGATVVALPETMRATAQATADLLAAGGRHFQVFSTTADSPWPIADTSLLISDELGRYRQLPATGELVGIVRAVPIDGAGPTLVAVHPPAPGRVIGFDQWAVHARNAANQCIASVGAVVAGDFNATVDHAPLTDLGRCADAASSVGRGAEGTWPSDYPAGFTAPIDHVLFDTGRYRSLRTRTERVGGSDHRALIAWLGAS
ncbi:Uncharacterized conserved protein YafD, endonuclease/exonuclease/phosphatase (EEP) superfamily [Nakamurella panacisegetis]|uniref:Uncharacterized conserved protein YafD, endonuclease/exonuclease/phosphatase (EEP) superfamily n=1 Tax=Nakamurella panacisegetis TaxID=1090615 RepID=A0A1H0KY71_9ACTN|nr:endonuclease/exonuclease/phosphatase family protein [Nakamurella panacisegetis]SDO60711.1 Uncharacterized conserved protein YafD, endonuclease/exonuclease/phosphatase (EEP) superfamily [Nakamurella panacisegetis]